MSCTFIFVLAISLLWDQIAKFSSLSELYSKLFRASSSRMAGTLGIKGIFHVFCSRSDFAKYALLDTETSYMSDVESYRPLSKFYCSRLFKAVMMFRNKRMS